MTDSAGRAVLEDVYQRLSQRIETKPIKVQDLKQAALEALAHAKERIEHDPEWVSHQLARLEGGPPAAPPESGT